MKDYRRRNFQKLQQWVEEKISTTLKPISEEISQTISSEVRAIVFNVFGALGTMLIGEHVNTIKNMTEHDKATISRIGIRIGVKFFFMPNFLKKQPMELNALLWKIFYEWDNDCAYPLPTDGRVSFITETKMPNSYWSAIGYHCLNNFAIRVDVFERVFFLVRQKIKSGPFLESSDLMNPVGCNSQQLTNILSFCGFKNISLGNEKKIFFYEQKKQKKIEKSDKKNKKKTVKVNNKKTPNKKEEKINLNSPFAVLQKLL